MRKEVLHVYLFCSIKNPWRAPAKPSQQKKVDTRPLSGASQSHCNSQRWLQTEWKFSLRIQFQHTCVYINYVYRYTVNGLWATLYIVQDQALHSLSKLWEGGLGLTCSHTNWNCESRRSRPKDLTENIPRAEVDPDGRCFLWWQAPRAAPCASHSQEWQGMKVQNNSLPRQKCLAAHERSEHRLERCWRRFFLQRQKLIIANHGMTFDHPIDFGRFWPTAKTSLVNSSDFLEHVWHYSLQAQASWHSWKDGGWWFLNSACIGVTSSPALPRLGRVKNRLQDE